VTTVVRGLLCGIVPITRANFAQVAGWLAASECESLLRGTSSLVSRESAYDGIESGQGNAVMITDRRGRAVGIAHWWRLGEGVYEIGGAVGDESLWRGGIGIEAAALIVDYLFEVLNCRRVEFTTGLHNSATISLGINDQMVIEAICHDYMETVDGPVPAVKSSLTREEYYRPYPHYQPRVGRRVDTVALARSIRSLHGHLDVSAIAAPMMAGRP
jgi:RimJ/RimL family protein N-acetyltransferase